MKENSQHTDKELFARIAQGDEAAFADIYLKYTDKLYPHVAKLLDSELWAEEIVQDVFVKLWLKKETIGTIENPSAWLYRMAGNKTLDFLKHRAVEVKMQYQISRQAEQWGKIDTQEQLDFRQSEQLFKIAVSTLPARQQEVFRLKHEQHLSYDEIANELRLSKNTVRNHLATAMDAIRVYFLERGILLLVWFLTT